MPQQRKVVTVLFADIVDSTGSVSGYDAEVVREALGRTFNEARAILTAHGATVEKFIGDAVMAVFGMPVTHEDDAERALRAALALRGAMPLEPPPDTPRFTFRIGINTGEVVTGDGEGGEFLVTGQAVVVAARLEQSAAPGEILVGSLTRELARGVARFGDPRRVDAKGIGSTEAAPLTGITAHDARPTTATAFVGRGAELDLLTRLHGRTAESRLPHLVTILGSPGIGKSRLASELMVRVAPAPAARAPCLPYGQAITYWPLQELIRADARILSTDSRDAARAKIDAMVTAVIPDPREAQPVSQELMALAIADQREVARELSTSERRRLLASAMRAFLEARLASGPATIVLEDLHWAEAPLLDLIEELLSHLRAPLFLLCLARHELLEHRPTWGTKLKNAATLTLDALPRADTELLAAQLLASRTPSRIAEIAAITEGNPLFVEEYVRLLDEGSHAVIPPTLQGIIAARIDATGPELRRILQEASVLGRDFWLDALPSAQREVFLIDDAERRDLVTSTGARGPSGSATYRFRHGVIRDVAYASLSKADRSEIHDHCARWLNEATGDRRQEYADIVAYHADRAFELAREIRATSTLDLGRAAFAAASASAAGARARSDFGLALRVYDRALEIAGTIGLADQDTVAAQATAAIMRHRLDASSEAMAEIVRVTDSARVLGPSEPLVRLLIWRASSITIYEDVVESRALFAEALAVARQLEDPRTISYAMWAACEPDGILGRLERQAAGLEEALTAIRSAGADQWLVSCLTEVSANALARGRNDLALARAEEALTLSGASGQRLDRFKAADAFARCLLAAGDAGAEAAAAEAHTLAGEVGGPWAAVQASEVLALAREATGDIASARAAVDEALAHLDPVRMPTQREGIARLEAHRARFALRLGDLEGASQAAERAMSFAPRTHAAVRAMSLAAAGAVASAEARQEQAAQLVDEALGILAPTDHSVLIQRLRTQRSSLKVRPPAVG